MHLAATGLRGAEFDAMTEALEQRHDRLPGGNSVSL
jgi:hypothetical protein